MRRMGFNLLDLTLAVGLFPLLGATLSYGVGVMGHNRLRPFRIEPSRGIVGQDARVSVFGTGLTQAVRTALIPFPMAPGLSVNEIRVDHSLSQDLPPGRYSLLIEDKDGRLTRTTDSIELAWQPQIQSVEPVRLTRNRATVFVIRGKFFAPQCRVQVGPVPITPEFIRNGSLERQTEPGRITFLNLALDLPAGRHDVKVTNPGGEEAALKDAVEIVERLPADFSILCAAAGLPLDALEGLRSLKGEYRWDAGVTIQNAETAMGDVAFLRVEMQGEMEEFLDGARIYYGRGDPIRPGVRIPITLPRASSPKSPLSANAVVLTEPEPPQPHERPPASSWIRRITGLFRWGRRR